MRIQSKAQGTPLTDSAKIYVERKIGRLSNLLTPEQDDAAVADVHLIYAPSNTVATKDKCHVTISGLGGGHTVHAESEEPDMHVAIDASAQLLEEQLRRLKEKTRDNLDRSKLAAKEVPAEDFMATEPVEDSGDR